MQRLTLAACAALTTILVSTPAHALYKCPQPGGGTAYQDMPCAGGAALSIKPASGQVARPAAVPSGAPSEAPPVAEKREPSPKPASSPPASQATAPAQPPSAPKNPEADMCLEWYKPLLRDPRGAYYTRASKDGRVMSITIHATNGYGGYITQEAQCEIHAGKLDHDWTRIHAKRGGWGDRP